MKYYMLLLICSLFFIDSCTKTVIDTVPVTQLAEWNKAPHNAFTDLIKFDGVYYCCFREAKTHLSLDGKIRIIRSGDAKNWDNASLLSTPGKDLRDSHFFVDDNNTLSILIHARDSNDIRKSYVYKLKNGSFVASENVDVDNDYWLWDLSKFKNKLYSVAYNTKQLCYSRLVNSSKPKLMLFENTNSDCTGFGKVESENQNAKSFKCPSEAAMVFTSDSTLITIVRDEDIRNAAHLGISKFPFKNWEWKQFPYYVRGPKLAMLPDGKIFLCAASMVKFDKTYYAILDPKTFAVETIKVFPSGGDTGYAGVIIEGNTALISYYSSHEGNTRVYIDRITY